MMKRKVLSMVDMKRIYVSVPMANSPDMGVALARRIADRVIAFGGIPVVPHDIEARPHSGPCPAGYGAAQEGHSSACWLRADILIMLDCDGVVFGVGWPGSTGAKLEMNVAASCGLPLYFDDDRVGVIRDTCGETIRSL